MRKPLCAVALMLPALLVQPTAAADEVDRYVEAQMRQLHIPGVALAVVHGGRTVKAQGYGFADLEMQVPVTPGTVFEIGSNTKQFTAALVMMLVEEGTVRLDDTLARHLPDAPAAWRGITIRQLLSHTSGIQNHVALPGYMGRFTTSILRETSPGRDELLEMFFELPLEFAAGETWAYDNTGYYLLGIIAERASGRPFWELVEERLFAPLGMNATRNTDPWPVIPNRASGYEWLGDRFENRPVLAPFIAFSAGALLSTVEDLAKWDAALSSERVLTRASLDAMWTPVRTNDGTAASIDYGLGWFIDSYNGHRITLHSGGTPGFSSAIYRFRDDALTVIVLTNHADRIVDHLAIDIAGMYVPALRRPERSVDPDLSLTQRHQRVLSELANGRYDPSAFTPAMATFLGTSTGRGLWQWLAYHGALESLAWSSSEVVGGLEVLRYRALIGDNPYWLSVKTTADGRIAQITWF